MSSNFDIAQICENGHVANSSTQDFPQFNQKYCKRCGSPTITNCPECNAPIRGVYREVFSTGYTAPGFCIECGKPFPWTESKLKAAHTLVQELDSLDDDEKEMLEKSLDDLVRDTPSTPVAATRFKKLVTRAGQGAASAFREILVDIASESAKKMLWP